MAHFDFFFLVIVLQFVLPASVGTFWSLLLILPASIVLFYFYFYISFF